MDQYGQIGPEKGSYARDVRTVARMLVRGETPVYVAHVARMTRLGLHLWLRSREGDLQVAPRGLEDAEWLYVLVDEHGGTHFEIGSYLAPDYIATRLNVTLADAKELGEFFARLWVELEQAH